MLQTERNKVKLTVLITDKWIDKLNLKHSNAKFSSPSELCFGGNYNKTVVTLHTKLDKLRGNKEEEKKELDFAPLIVII